MCVVGLGIVTIGYTIFGGVKSVIWNDCIQFVIYMAGAAAILWVIVSRLPDGMSQLVAYGQANQKFGLFDFDLGLTKGSMTFWSGLVGGMFLTTATHGTDQMMVQRYLAAKSPRGAAWAVMLSGIMVALQFALFLFIGVGLACFYEVVTTDVAFTAADKDRVLAHFVVNHLTTGLVGLVLAAVFAAAMSTLSSSLNSSATAAINDIYLPIASQEVELDRQLVLSRYASAFFGVVQIAIALVSYQIGINQSTVDLVLKIAGFALGPMLGLYFLALFTPRVQQRAALLGFVTGAAILSGLAFGVALYGYWFAFVGASATFISGLFYSKLRPQNTNGKVSSA